MSISCEVGAWLGAALDEAINNLEGTELILIRFADRTKPGGAAGISESKAAFQTDLDMLAGWAKRNTEEINKSRSCSAPGREPCIAMDWGLMAGQHLCCSGLGDLADDRLSKSQPCVLAAINDSNTPGCTKSTTVSRIKEGTVWHSLDSVWNTASSFRSCQYQKT